MTPEIETPDQGLVFISTPSFDALADKHLGAEGWEAMQADLLRDPAAGDVIPGVEGARKLRVALDGRGKRGGARVIYFYRDTRGAIFLLALYPKNKQTDLSGDEKKALRSIIRQIKEEDYP